MYSRSYGTIESDDKGQGGLSVPKDYHGSFYRRPEAEPVQPPTKAPSEETASPAEALPTQKRPTAGSALGFLERLSAEDILLFVFLFSLLRTEEGDESSILGLILALLFL